MTYSVKETFYTLQGEGAHTGRAAVFLRFSGCNLWTGREEDRSQAICQFCDTDFIGTDGPGGGKFKTPEELAAHVKSFWPELATGTPYVVCTGGEPLLQLDTALIDALHGEGFEIGVESNGTIEAPEGIDWLCISPKSGSELVQMTGDELKIVIPQEGIDPANFEVMNFKRFSVQPLEDENLVINTTLAAEFVQNHPKWRLSLQTHKILGIP